jgi:hypothetical protein
MKPKPKPRRAWAIVTPEYREEIMVNLMEWRRKDAIEQAEKNFYSTWRELCLRGYRCIRVKVVPE